MTRKSTYEENSGNSAPADRADSNASKQTFNRREYIRLGAVSTATVLGVGSGVAATSLASSETPQTFTTDFSEYAL